ncbi:hypothetical protein L208DRAFT_1374735 [Tricholoma matsutake]|nr:hypothetical protein L208DRAFT_1374735 [Tricholoma matsutake 945]
MEGIPDQGKLNSTIGAQLIGNIVAAMCIYIATATTGTLNCSFAWYDLIAASAMLGADDDNEIWFLWFLDSLQLAFVTHGSYNLLVLNFRDPSSVYYTSPICMLPKSLSDLFSYDEHGCCRNLAGGM